VNNTSDLQILFSKLKHCINELMNTLHPVYV